MKLPRTANSSTREPPTRKNQHDRIPAMTVPTKIRAVAEDPENPLLDCYADDPTALAKFFATGTITPTAPPTKKDTTTMSFIPRQ